MMLIRLLREHLVPYQRATWAVLLDRGFVVAVANLRGGSEYGDTWHEEGRLLKKQNVFDDFAAAAQHLVKRGYTKPERLAIEGGSNGGLLMGATLVQHPDLARAVVSHVGIYDMLRVELSANGAFNAVVPVTSAFLDGIDLSSAQTRSIFKGVIGD